MGEVIDGEPEELLEEENLVDEEEAEDEDEEEKGHQERAFLALDLTGRGSSSGLERGVEQFDVVFPQPRKERRRWVKVAV